MIKITPPKAIPGVEQLNQQFGQLDVEERLRQLYKMYKAEEVLVTSSFGTDSAQLLHLISKVKPSQRIFFIDTGFHFPETLSYKKQLTKMLNLQVIDIRPSPALHKLTKRKQLWESHPDSCCFLNKVMVLNPLKLRHKIWISGLREHQTEQRSKLPFFKDNRSYENILRCSPLLDVNDHQSKLYLEKNNLPLHPLRQKGYCSIGCYHCTIEGPGRSGRWANLNKTECGLHMAFP